MIEAVFQQTGSQLPAGDTQPVPPQLLPDGISPAGKLPEPRELSVSTPTSSGFRFHALRLHAKGGSGEVLVAEDSELHREVALKQLQSQHADDPASRARFVLEGEIPAAWRIPELCPSMGWEPMARAVRSTPCVCFGGAA